MAEITPAAATANAPARTPANVPDAGSRREHPFAPVSPTRKAVEATGPTVKFARYHFQDGLTGMPATTPDNGRRIDGVTPSDEVTFSKDVVTGLRGFTQIYTQRLINLENRAVTVGGIQTNLYEEMKRAQGGAYSEDEFMLQAFTEKQQVGDRVVRKIKTPDQINAIIMRHPEMVDNLTVVAERFASDALASMGLRAELRRPGNRIDVDRLPVVIDLGIDQGSGHAAVSNTRRFFNRRQTIGGRDTGGMTNRRALAATMAGGTLGGTIGLGALGQFVGHPELLLASPVLGPLVTAIGVRAMRPGVQLALVRDDEVAARSLGPAESQRALNLFRIDPADLQHSADGIGTSLQEAVQLIYLRAEYMAGLDVPPQQLDALSEQFLFAPGQVPEAIDDTLRRDVFANFRALHGYDFVGNIDQQRMIYRQAQEQALITRFNDVLQGETGQQVQIDQAERLRKAIEGRGPNGEITSARTKDARAEDGMLQEDKNALGTQRDALKDYQAEIKKANEARAKVRRILGRINGGGLDYAAALTVLTEARTMAVHDVDIATETGIKHIVDNLTNFNTQRAAVNADIARIRPRAPTEDRADYKERRAREIEAIETSNLGYVNAKTERALLDSTIADLRNLNQEAEDATRAAESTTAVTNGVQALADMQDAETRLHAMIVAVPAGVPLSLTSLMTQINTAGIAAGGWERQANNLPQNRELVRRALMQHRVNENMHNPALLPGGAGLEAAFDDVANNPTVALRIGAEQLRLLSIAELNQRADILGIPAADLVRGRFADAQRWANAQLEFTQRAITEEQRIIDGESLRQKAIIQGASSEAEVAQLSMIRDVYVNRDQVAARADTAYNSRAQLIDAALVPAGTPGFREAEINSGLPRNVLEIVNILTGYRNSGDVGGDFARILTNLGPGNDRLLGMLQRTYGRWLDAPAAPPTMLDFAARLQAGINANAILSSNFGQATRNMVEELLTWSRSI